jgi:hypothetical protein
MYLKQTCTLGKIKQLGKLFFSLATFELGKIIDKKVK